jgi:GTP-binding protein
MVYAGQVIGEHCKDDDIPVNVVKQKRLTNMRAASKDQTVILKSPRRMSLEAALEYIANDELVELTPTNIRIRKRLLSHIERRRESRKTPAGT